MNEKIKLSNKIFLISSTIIFIVNYFVFTIISQSMTLPFSLNKIFILFGIILVLTFIYLEKTNYIEFFDSYIKVQKYKIYYTEIDYIDIRYIVERRFSSGRRRRYNRRVLLLENSNSEILCKVDTSSLGKNIRYVTEKIIANCPNIRRSDTVKEFIDSGAEYPVINKTGDFIFKAIFIVVPIFILLMFLPMFVFFKGASSLFKVVTSLENSVSISDNSNNIDSLKNKDFISIQSDHLGTKIYITAPSDGYIDSKFLNSFSNAEGLPGILMIILLGKMEREGLVFKDTRIIIKDTDNLDTLLYRHPLIPSPQK